MPDSNLNPGEIDQLIEERPRRRRLGLVTAVLLAAAGLGAVMLAHPGSSGDRGYETVAVERRDLIATVSATGHLEPTDQVDVGSEISGMVADVLADTNDPVVAGQILAVIDTTKLEQQTERSRAALLAAEASVRQALATQTATDADLVRFEEVHQLSDGRVPSQSELDAARAAKLRADAAVKVAEADVAESKAAVLANEIDLERSVIRSPIDGVVLDCRVDPGQTVAASFQAPVLFTIGQDLGRMNLTVYVSEADVGRVAEGQKATFTVDAWPESEFEAVVRKVNFGSQTIQNVVSYVTELEVANDDLKLRPGMTATATIRIAEREDALVVSNAALRFRVPARKESSGAFSLLPVPPDLGRSEAPTGGDAVYALRDGALARVTVEAGLSDGRWTEVSATGLNEGEVVVVGLLEAS
ncbi:MAG: efflux RND transporter periplasmic adaptor subunit [Thermoanaerobaculales bacterium]|jgi:HlyD family secretion protein|nr:efflux RND transporter periplasmic adaptor subunit [Thermoanaerobaculales bacterium]